MAATIYKETARGRRKVTDVIHSPNTPPGTPSFVDFQVYQFGRPTRDIIRIVPKFSGAPYTPPGAHILLMEKQIDPPPLTDAVKVIETLDIRNEDIDMTRLRTLRGQKDISLLRLRTSRPGKLLRRSHVVVSGW